MSSATNNPLRSAVIFAVLALACTALWWISGVAIAAAGLDDFGNVLHFAVTFGFLTLAELGLARYFH